MARRLREGLRVLLSGKDEVKKKNNADKCKTYRGKMKDDPVFREANKAKCKAYRSRQLTEQELEKRRAAGRERSRKYRMMKKTQSEDGPLHTSTPKPAPKTRAAVDAQREYWRQQKQKQREEWTSQKWRRHREKCAAYIQEKRNAGRVISSPVKHKLASPRCTPPPCNVYSPSPGKLKSAFKATMTSLKSQRSKEALAKKRLFSALVSTEEDDPESILYKRRKIKFSTETARQFLVECAVDAPGKRSVSKRTGEQKKILPNRMKRLQKEFERQHPNMKVSLRTLYRLLPKNVLTSRKLQFHQCLCEKCANIDLKLDVLNRHLEEKIDGRDVLSEASLCSITTEACLHRTCTECGTEKVQNKISASVTSPLETEISWKVWENVKSDDGKNRKDLVTKTGSLDNLVAELLSDLVPFSGHLANFRWQYLQLKTIKCSLPLTWALVIMDFAENFHCRFQNEIQSVYWSYRQITIHPCVLHFACSECGEQVTEHLIFMSDDLKHDAHIVKTIMGETEAHLEQQMVRLDKLVVFSDGCPTHYKSKVPFHHIASSSGVETERCFFGSRHGKSECDAAGGVIKRLLEDDILTGSVIQTAADAFQHCVENHQLPELSTHGCCHKRRSFKLVTSKDIDRSLLSSELCTLKGTRQIHSVKRVGPNTVSVRKRSCFCASCLASLPHCENNIPWEIVDLSAPAKKPTYRRKSASHTKAKAKRVKKTTPQPCPSSETPQPNPRSGSEIAQRELCFTELLQAMGDCTTFHELELLVFRSTMTPLPDCLPKTIVDVGGCIDKKSLLLLKETDIEQNLYPVCTGADGNCLPRAASRLIYGHEDLHSEMRCRIVHELVRNKGLYLEGEGFGGREVARTLAEFAGTTFEEEVMAVRKPGIAMGLWQVAALANLTNLPIYSVYPKLGWHQYATIHNRLVTPAQPREPHMAAGAENAVQPGALHLLWTTNRDDMSEEHWVANHFVPLLPIVAGVAEADVDDFLHTAFCIEDVGVGDFYVVEWEGKEFIAQVQEVEADLQLARVSYMTAKNGRYCWPGTEDVSWESFSSLKKKVFLELNLAVSNQRIQYFNLC